MKDFVIYVLCVLALVGLFILASASKAQAGGRPLKAVVVNDGFGPRVVFVEDVGFDFRSQVNINVRGRGFAPPAAVNVNVNQRRFVPLFRRGNNVNVNVR